LSRGVTAADALARLREGNARFVANVRSEASLASAARRAELAIAQEPFAIVLGCSDSRVPVEIVFDQGPGDLFVIRVAGNIVAPSLIGSVEFAADRFGTRLVVVLGHSSCGAIQATLEELRRPSTNQSPNLKAIVDRIRPAVGPRDDEQTAMRANILASVTQLRHGSSIIEGLVGSNGLVIVGAWYSLESGVVEFLEETLPG
jgi:carbonic anhydrase